MHLSIYFNDNPHEATLIQLWSWWEIALIFLSHIFPSSSDKMNSCLTCSSYRHEGVNAAWRRWNHWPLLEWKQPWGIHTIKGFGIQMLIYYFRQSAYLRKWAWRMTNRCFLLRVCMSVSCDWFVEYYKIGCTTTCIFTSKIIGNVWNSDIKHNFNAFSSIFKWASKIYFHNWLNV